MSTRRIENVSAVEPSIALNTETKQQQKPIPEHLNQHHDTEQDTGRMKKNS